MEDLKDYVVVKTKIVIVISFLIEIVFIVGSYKSLFEQVTVV